MRICVIGGGIGGLATANALQQKGLDAQVYESAADLASVGKGIWVPTNAMLVLDRLGLGEAVAARGVALDRVEIRTLAAEVLQAIDLTRVQQRFGRTTVSVLRADLQRVLAGALQPGTLHLGHRCVSVDGGGSRPIARFDDGTEVQADLVIGADGLRSVARQAVAQDVSFRYSGQTCYLGLADAPLPEDLARTVWEIWGGTARFGFSAVGPERVYWFAPVTAPHGGATARVGDSEIAVFREHFARFPDPVPEIISRTPPAEVLRVDLTDFAPIRSWHRGRVVLVGDAAHAMTPNLGQGGAQAIEDAYVLAECLATESDLALALSRYERIRQPKAARLVRTAWWLGKMAHIEGRWPRRIRNTALRSTPKSMNRRQLDSLYQLDY